jgi:hypothetical protein
MVFTNVNKDERDSEGERKPSPRRVVHFPWVDSEEEKERTERGHLSRKVSSWLSRRKGWQLAVWLFTWLFSLLQLRKLAKMTDRNKPREVAEITIAGDWIRDTANNRRIHDLYNEHQFFRYPLERLLQQREHRPIFAWWGQFQQVIKFCYTPSLDPARLENFRKLDAKDLTEDKKFLLQNIFQYLTLVKENIQQPSAARKQCFRREQF